MEARCSGPATLGSSEASTAMAAPVQISHRTSADSVQPICVQGAKTPKPAMQPATARPMKRLAGRVPRVRKMPLKVLPAIIMTLATAMRPEAALKVMRPVFVELLGEEPPVSLGWDDGAFLAVATGRRVLTESERVLLGSRHERFPLLS